MKEIAFKLEPDEDGWPPVGAEWLWLQERGRRYIVKTPPLFISGFAVGDEIELCDTTIDGQVTEWRMVSPGDRSLIWIADLGGAGLKDILVKFRKIGCNTSMPKQIAVASIDVPPEVSRAQIDAILDPLDKGDYAIAFPCDRQS
jgi:uncharacterized protein DUF4265